MFYYSRAFRVHISYGLYVFYMLCRVVVFELNHYDSLFVFGNRMHKSVPRFTGVQVYRYLVGGFTIICGYVSPQQS